MRFKQRQHCILSPPIYLLIIASYFVVPPFASALSVWNPATNKRIGEVVSMRQHGSRNDWNYNDEKSCKCDTNMSVFRQQSILTSSRTVVGSNKGSLLSAIFTCRGGTATTTDLYASRDNKNYFDFMNDSKQASSSATDYSKDISSYHLLWSPGSWRKIITSTMSICVLHLLLSRMLPQFKQLPFFFGKEQHSPFCPDHAGGGLGEGAIITAGTNNKASFLLKLFNLLTIPLLSSACCSIQLILNALAGLGCAGFNTYLGPLRPFFISILMYSTAMSSPLFPSSLTRPSMKKWAIVSIASWAIALSPELVHFWNNVSSRRSLADNKDDSAVMTTKATLELNIPSMGCVACINKINSSIRTQSQTHIIEATSWLTKDEESGGKGGRAKVLLSASSEQEVQNVVKDIVDSVGKGGFACSIDKLSMETRHSVR